ncbi:hypothetical protein ACLK2D_21495 [Escherichia coli]
MWVRIPSRHAILPVGLYLTVIGYLLLLLFAATWWKILGLM